LSCLEGAAKRGREEKVKGDEKKSKKKKKEIRNYL